MTQKNTMTTLVLLGAVLLTGTVFAAAELPSQEGRMWAPTGDVIGLENNATVGITSWDPHGNKPKYAEDWQQEDDVLFNVLFGFNNIYSSGRHLTLRGFGESGRGPALAGRFTLKTSTPGKDRVFLEFRSFKAFSDVTSEMRARSFAAPPAPPAMLGVPSNCLKMGRVDLGYNLGKGFGMNVGLNRLCRSGDKASLLRGSFNTGDHVPNRKVWDTTTNEFLAGVTYRNDSLDSKLEGSFRTTQGDRLVGTHAYRDDQTLYRVGLDANYRLGGRTNLLGVVNTSKLEAKNGETLGTNTYSPNGEAKTVNGRLGVISRLGQATTARLTAGYGTWNTEHLSALDGTTEQAAMRDRTNYDLGLLLTNTSLNKTRLRFNYRYRTAQLDETVEQVAVGTQAIDQKRQSHRAGLRGDIRLSRKSSLKATLDWRNLKVDQTNSGDDLFYTMGDRKVNRFQGGLALQTRPMDKMRLEVGFRSHNQQFQREDMEGVKTQNTAYQGILGFNYRASERLTLVLPASYGLEKYEIVDGPQTGVGMSPIYYEGKTLRFAPGLIAQLAAKWDFEAHYEGVRFEDPADAADEFQLLKSDLDRILLRTGYMVAPNMKVTASYRRHEFDENRWDDYIMDLYSLSFSGRF